MDAVLFSDFTQVNSAGKNRIFFHIINNIYKVGSLHSSLLYMSDKNTLRKTKNQSNIAQNTQQVEFDIAIWSN